MVGTYYYISLPRQRGVDIQADLSWLRKSPVLSGWPDQIDRFSVIFMEPICQQGTSGSLVGEADR